MLVATITDFAPPGQDEPDSFPAWFLGEKAARPVWWRESDASVSFEADRSEGCQIALRGRLDEENCEIETIRFFYDGDCDPFIDDYRAVPNARLQELGVFVLPSNRQRDKLLSFGSSSFMKVLRQSSAIPGTELEELKAELVVDDVRQQTLEDAGGVEGSRSAHQGTVCIEHRTPRPSGGSPPHNPARMQSADLESRASACVWVSSLHLPPGARAAMSAPSNSR